MVRCVAVDVDVLVVHHVDGIGKVPTHLRAEVLVEHLLDRRRPDSFAELGDEHAVGGEQACVAGVVAGVEVLGVVDEDLPYLLAGLELCRRAVSVMSGSLPSRNAVAGLKCTTQAWCARWSMW